MTESNDEAALPGDDQEASASMLREAVRLSARGDAFASNHIFGAPVKHGDVVVIPLGRMRGGGGGGGGGGGARPGDQQEEDSLDDRSQRHGSGVGTGWGMDGKATGAIVIRGDRVRFIPAVDVTRIVTVSILGMVATVVLAPRIIRAARGEA
jgi:uncharacterized spore protein YtfJ